LKQTTGINWARIGLLYPRHRAFDDGAADIFGNFTRARRGHWLWGCIFGPTDSKSFEEVDREKKSQARSNFFVEYDLVMNQAYFSTFKCLLC
uniref:Dynein_C domain-containing protein n=1 Tax=Angiostrongylus cantonensis TaxID=6313 RepID=A0A0K0D013_ANGCA